MSVYAHEYVWTTHTSGWFLPIESYTSVRLSLKLMHARYQCEFDVCCQVWVRVHVHACVSKSECTTITHKIACTATNVKQH